MSRSKADWAKKRKSEIIDRLFEEMRGRSDMRATLLTRRSEHEAGTAELRAMLEERSVELDTARAKNAELSARHERDTSKLAYTKSRQKSLLHWTKVLEGALGMSNDTLNVVRALSESMSIEERERKLPSPT